MRVIRANIDTRLAGVRAPGAPGQATSLEYTLRDGGGASLDFNPSTQLVTLTNAHGTVSVHVSRLQELELAAPEEGEVTPLEQLAADLRAVRAELQTRKPVTSAEALAQQARALRGETRER